MAKHVDRGTADRRGDVPAHTGGARTFARGQVVVAPAGDEARERFFQMSLDLLAIIDQAGRFQEMNGQWQKVLGWHPDLLRGRSVLDLVHPDDRHRVSRAARAMVDESFAGEVEMRMLHAEGGHRWLEWTAMFDAEKALYYGVARDRTAHRDIEALSRASVEDVEDYAMFMLDPGGRVRTWNRGAERCKGYAADQIIGRHISVFCAAGKEHRAREILEAARAQGRADDEGWRVRRDGSLFWAHVVITAVHDRDGKVVGFTTLTRDLTQRLRNEEAQRHALRQALELNHLEQLSRMRANLLNMVAHELRTPLTPLRMQVQMLNSRRLGPVTQQQHDAIGMLDRNLARVTRLINDILEVSRLEADRLPVHLADVPLDDLLHDAVATYGPAAASKGVRLHQEAPCGLLVRCDPDRLLQVLYNLVDNAVKFTPPEGAVTLRAMEDNGVLVEVEDTGRGLTKDEQELLFEPFVQVHGTNVGGSGLGLFISRGIMARHGGAIGCSSDGQGAGATFWLRLPVDPPHPDEVPAPSAHGSGKAAAPVAAGQARPPPRQPS